MTRMLIANWLLVLCMCVCAGTCVSIIWYFILNITGFYSSLTEALSFKNLRLWDITRTANKAAIHIRTKIPAQNTQPNPYCPGSSQINLPVANVFSHNILICASSPIVFCVGLLFLACTSHMFISL